MRDGQMRQLTNTTREGDRNTYVVAVGSSGTVTCKSISRGGVGAVSYPVSRWGCTLSHCRQILTITSNSVDTSGVVSS